MLLLVQVLDGGLNVYPEQNQQALTNGDLVDASAHWACMGEHRTMHGQVAPRL